MTRSGSDGGNPQRDFYTAPTMPSFFPNDYPSLPQFSSLLVKGSYHPTAPLHLALSQLALSLESTALFLSSSSIHLNLALRQYNDDWLATHSGHGDLAAVSSRVQLFYPPTPAHLFFLLSTLHVVNSSANNDDLASSKSVLACRPVLIVLHELSSYFLRDVQEQPASHSWTVSSYLNLVTQTASLISFLSPARAGSTPPTVLALFDSRIDELKLPVLRHPTSGNERQPFAATEHHARSSGVEEIALLVQNYFQWTAVFSSEESTSPQEHSMDGQDIGKRSMRLELYKHRLSDAVHIHRWSEQRVPLGSEEGWRTQFTF